LALPVPLLLGTLLEAEPAGAPVLPVTPDELDIGIPSDPLDDREFATDPTVLGPELTGCVEPVLVLVEGSG